MVTKGNQNNDGFLTSKHVSSLGLKRQEHQDMSSKVTKNFKALVPLLVKKSYKSLEINLSLDGAKKTSSVFSLKVSF